MISIIIPLYNKAQYIQKTIQSVLTQSYSSFELLVVDDGSTDDSIEKVLSIKDDRIRVIKQKNRGVSYARNRGIQEAQYDSIAFLDADDKWFSNHLETLVSLQEKYPQCGLVASAYQMETSDEKVIMPHIGKCSFNGEDGVLTNYYKIASGNDFPFNMNSFMVQKSMLERVKGFPVNVHAAEDILTIARLFAISDFAYTHKVTNSYFVTFDETFKRKILDDRSIDQNFSSLLTEGKSRKEVDLYVASWFKRRMVGEILQKRYQSAFNYFWKSFLLKPLNRKLYSSLLVALLTRVSGKNFNQISTFFSKRKIK